MAYNERRSRQIIESRIKHLRWLRRVWLRRWFPGLIIFALAIFGTNMAIDGRLSWLDWTTLACIVAMLSPGLLSAIRPDLVIEWTWKRECTRLHPSVHGEKERLVTEARKLMGKA